MFKFLIIFLLVIIFVPTVRRFLFQLLVGREIAKQQRRYNDMMQNQQAREGEIRVDKKPNSNKKANNGTGQYIDYEEVK